MEGDQSAAMLDCSWNTKHPTVCPYYKSWILFFLFGLLAASPQFVCGNTTASGTVQQLTTITPDPTDATIIRRVMEEMRTVGGKMEVNGQSGTTEAWTLPDQPPQIVALEQVVLEKDTNRTFTCIGRRPVEWYWDPAKQDMDIYTSSADVISEATGPKVYSEDLYIVNAQWYYTRFYRCRYKGVTTTTTPSSAGMPGGMFVSLDPPVRWDGYEDGDGVWASKIFIFVSDAEHPFQETRSEYNLMVYDKPFHIDCGVTDPKFEVILTANFKNVTNDPYIQWDARTGFQVHTPTFHFLSGVSCVAFTVNHTNGYHLIKHVFPHHSSSQAVSPYVKPNKTNFKAGETLVIKCKVKVVTGNIIFIYFNYTSMEQKLERYDDKDPLRVTGNNGYDDITRTLTVTNVQPEDSGIYRCKTTVDHKNFEESSVAIEVWDTAFVNITAMSPAVYALDTDRATMLSYNVKAAPQPKFKWYFGDREINTENAKPYLSLVEETQVKLFISNPQSGLSGKYSLVASVVDNNSTISEEEAIILYVSGKPNVTVHAKSRHDNLPPKTVTIDSHPSVVPRITCHIVGYPPSNVTWFFQACQAPYCAMLEDPAAWQDITNRGEHKDKSNQQPVVQTDITETMFINEKRNGYYRCLAQNEHGNASDYVLMLISDKEGIQSVYQSPTRELTPGDSLVMTCSAHRWLYRSVELFKDGWNVIPEVAGIVIGPTINETTSGNESTTIPTTSTTSYTDRSNAPASYVDSNSDKVAMISLQVPGSVGTTTPSSYTSSTELTETGLVRPYTMGPSKPGDNRLIVTHTQTENMIQVTLSWKALKDSDVGKYYCSATTISQNATHTLTHYLRLHDIIPPVISDQTLGSRRVDIGSSTVFRCDVQGLPPPNVTWKKDGEHLNVTETDRYHLSRSRISHVLTIKNATLADEGSYQCIGINFGGTVLSKNMTLHVGEAPVQAGFSVVHIGVIVGIVLLIILIFIVIIIKIKCAKKGFHQELEQLLIGPQGDYNPDLPIDEQTGCLPYDEKWEFPKDRLKLGMILGQGAFGRVMKADAIGIQSGENSTTVAVKMVKDCTDKDQMMALLSELKILIHIGQHLNILNLLGAVTKDIRFGELYVIVEYCHFGNLRSYLIKNKDYFQDTMDDLDDQATGGTVGSGISPPPYDASAPTSPTFSDGGETTGPYYVNKAGGPHGSAAVFGPSLTTKNLYCWAFQAARGMEFLASRKYIHRDLAARNVLLSEDNVVKICDFGLAKDLYQDQEYFKKGDGPVPVKWMALESFTHRIYTTKSDVWSYGVLLWELFSLGGNPYPGVEINEKFISLLKSGYRMDRPPFASEDLYRVMLQTWKVDPEERPSFSSLVSTMGDFLEVNVKQYYLDLSSDYLKAPGDGSDDEGGVDKGDRNILTDPDGYLKMSPTLGPDYSNIIPTSPKSNSFDQIDETAPHYVNQKRWKKGDKKDDMELIPLNSGERKSSLPDTLAPGFVPDGDNQVHTVAEVHQLEETDSGHSSSYEGAGPSPVGNVSNDDYLIPATSNSPPHTPPLSTDKKVQPEQKTATPSNTNTTPQSSDKPATPLASKLPVLRQAPSSSTAAPRYRQLTPLRPWQPSTTNSTSSGESQDRSANSTPRRAQADGGLATSNPGYLRQNGSDGFIPTSTSPSSSPNNSGGFTLASLPKSSSTKPTPVNPPPPKSSSGGDKKRPGIPRFQEKTRVYTPGGVSSKEKPNKPLSNGLKNPPTSKESSTSSTPSPLPASTNDDPFSRYNRSVPPASISPSSPLCLDVEDPQSDDANQSPVLGGSSRSRLGKSRSGLGQTRFLSNASSGYNSDLSPAESTPPPDYNAVLEDVTETDILV